LAWNKLSNEPSNTSVSRWKLFIPHPQGGPHEKYSHPLVPPLDEELKSCLLLTDMFNGSYKNLYKVDEENHPQMP